MRCALRVATSPSNNERRRQNKVFSHGAWRRPLAQWNACVWVVHALTPLPVVFRTARHLSGSGAGKTVTLRFGGVRFTENERMNKNGVFLSPCSFLFQAPMAQHVAERTAQHTQKNEKRTCSLERSCFKKRTLSGRPSVCGVRSRSPLHPQTTSAVVKTKYFRTVHGDVPLLSGTRAFGSSTL